MQLHEALGRIADIRSHLVRTETFRGYRAFTVGLSGLLGIAAAGVQARSIPNPMNHLFIYTGLWIGIALVSLLAVAAELAQRWANSAPLKRSQTVLAIQQFVPCLAAGAGLTAAIVLRAPDTAWMLPGLWAIVFGLGAFSSRQLLPKATVWVGVYYLATGIASLVAGNGPHALSPWFMVMTFGAGQLLSAAILYFTLERSNETPEA